MRMTPVRVRLPLWGGWGVGVAGPPGVGKHHGRRRRRGKDRLQLTISTRPVSSIGHGGGGGDGVPGRTCGAKNLWVDLRSSIVDYPGASHCRNRAGPYPATCDSSSIDGHGGQPSVKTNTGQMGQNSIFSPIPHLPFFIDWCLGRESNPHGDKRQGILSPLCLPIPPPRQLKQSVSYPPEARGASFHDPGQNFYHNPHR